MTLVFRISKKTVEISDTHNEERELVEVDTHREKRQRERVTYLMNLCQWIVMLNINIK